MDGKRLTGRLMPSLGVVLFLTTLSWTLSLGAGLLNDGDTGWHIVTGTRILDGLGIPFADPYSHTLPGIDWTTHEWLAEVILAGLHRAAGLNGVVVFTASVIALTFYFLYVYMRARGVNPLTAAMLTAVATSASTLHWLARPHALSLPLTLAFITALESYQRGGRDRLLWLPALMVFWVNVHAGYILGIMLVGLYLGGNVLRLVLSSGQDEDSKRKAKRLALVLALTVVATSINPRGPAILYFPFHLVGREFIMDNVLEWLSPNFHENWSFELMLVVLAAIFVGSRKRPDVFEAAASLMMLHMSLYSARYIPLMALIVMPMAAVRADEVLGRLSELLSALRPLGRLCGRIAASAGRTALMEARFSGRFWIYAAIAACLAVSLNGGRLGGRQLMDYRHDPARFPVDAVEFALANDIQGRMFNNDGWGGYVIYRAYPRFSVFFDGRSDMYGVPFMKKYMKVVRVHLGWDEVLDDYGVGWVMYNANSPLCILLAATGDWKLIYADKTANILVRDTPEYRRLIEKYPDVGFVPKDPEGR